MSLLIGELPRLPDALVDNSWVKELEPSRQGEGPEVGLAYGEKLEPLRGLSLDQVDLGAAISLDTLPGSVPITDRRDSSFVVKGRQDFVAFTAGSPSEKARELAGLMAEYPAGVPLTLGGLSAEQLARLAGGIGREIDAAFAAGEVSEQEYADLNQGLASYTEFMAGKSEREQAAFALAKGTAAAIKAQIRGGASEEELSESAALIRESWQDKLSAYLEDNAIDRAWLWEMLAAIRTGAPFSAQG